MWIKISLSQDPTERAAMKSLETAKEYHYSRSELFTLAAKEFLEKVKSKRLLEALNDAYSEPETPEETSLREKGKKYYSRKVLKRRS
ncbi:MAG: CopG family transcriptional regulator [Deltaproteobacteria bacterium]|nr:CopG family transcriptional regulator [Deltaproteobacteria bacterium]